MQLKQQKCEFLMSEVESYLPKWIAANTYQSEDYNTEAPSPTSVSKLRAFLELVNYYRKFFSNLTTTVASLYKLLQKNVKWSWGLKEELVFKKQLTADTLLVHYDPNAELFHS